MSCVEKKQSPLLSPITSLPEDVFVNILARVSICDYPRVSLVSKCFRLLVSSPEIYARRSSLGCTENCLYVVLYDNDNKRNGLYTLRKDKGLVLIPGLPDMPCGGSFVAVGSRMYVFCGFDSFIIDCTSHTVQPLPRMPVHMSYRVAGVIGGRIYVFGYHDQKSYGMLVFDTETQTWEAGMTKPVMKVHDRDLVVMAGKMYMRDSRNSFVYDPKESKLETDEVLNSMAWQKACVVDDVLYCYDYLGKEFRGYDPVHTCWGVVTGLDDFWAEMRRVGCHLARTVSYAGRLVLFFHRQGATTGEICCAEISLEIRKAGQIWGKVDQWRSDHALIAGNFIITRSLDVVL